METRGWCDTLSTLSAPGGGELNKDLVSAPAPAILNSMRFACLSLLLIATFARAERLPDLAVPDALGVNIHFTDPKPGEMKMLADAGFKWVRMDFTWGGTERKAGEFSFDAYDRLLAALELHGIRAVFILDYSNRLYDGGVSPHTDEGRAAMAKWAAAAVAHFKGRGVVWEMWNEPNIAQFWKPRPNADDYAKLALAVAKAIRAASPDELHVGPATSTIDLKFLETCFKAGLLEYWDTVSVHPYRQKDPETANDEYRKLRLLIAKYAPKDKKIPILSGEWGYSSAWASFDEARQAKYLPRQMLTNLYNEIPISIWYDWHDDGQDPKEGEHHFGTVHNPYRKDTKPVYEPKPAYLAMKTLTQQLGGFSYNKRLALESPQDYCLLFSKGDDVRLACWTTGERHAAVLPASRGDFVLVEGASDRTTTASADASGLSVTLTDIVTYVMPKDKNDLLRAAAACDRVPLESTQQGPSELRLSYSFRNPLAVPIAVAVNLQPPVTLDPGRTSTFGVNRFIGRSPIPEPLLIRIDVRSLGSFSQLGHIISSNPLDATLLPHLNENGTTLPLVVVRLTNPSRQPAALKARVTSDKGLYWPEATVDAELPSGVTETYVPFEMGCPGRASYSAAVTLLDEEDRIVLALPKRQYHFVLGTWDAPKSDPKVTADGDRAVKSDQRLTTAPSPKDEEPNPQFIPATCLKLSYSFDPGWKFIQIKPEKDDLKTIPGKPKELSVWIRGDGSRTVLRCRFTDSTGQTFQPTGPTIDFKGWRYVTIPLNGPDVSHWGKGDGQIHYPIKWDTLLLIDNVSREKTAGELYFTGLMLIE
jgi:hypothetical protein